MSCPKICNAFYHDEAWNVGRDAKLASGPPLESILRVSSIISMRLESNLKPIEVRSKENKALGKHLDTVLHLRFVPGFSTQIMFRLAGLPKSFDRSRFNPDCTEGNVKLHWTCP